MPKPSSAALLLLASATLALPACNRQADEPTTPMNAESIPENQGMGGAYDNGPRGAASEAGADTAANAPAQDSSAADGTTPTQPGTSGQAGQPGQQ